MYKYEICQNDVYIIYSVQIRVFQLAGNFKANLKASASYKRHLEIQLESKRILKGAGTKL